MTTPHPSHGATVECPCACHWHQDDGTKWHDTPCCGQPVGSKDQKPMPFSDIAKSVVYRDGPITEADYDEAIKDLQNAKRQDECRHFCCSVCEDTGHTAETCHHNPLVLARRAASDETVWRCYHCDFTAASHREAEEHFGRSDFSLPLCILKNQLSAVEKSIADYPQSSITEIRDALKRIVATRTTGNGIENDRTIQPELTGSPCGTPLGAGITEGIIKNGRYFNTGKTYWPDGTIKFDFDKSNATDPWFNGTISDDGFINDYD